MKIQLIENLPNDEYHNGKEYVKYWSSSNLKSYLKTPRQAYFDKFQAEKQESSVMSFGTLFHDFMASKHVNGQKFDYNIFDAPINPKTGKEYGKETKAYQDALSSVENPVTASDLKIVLDIWDMILNSEYAYKLQTEILSQGKTEVSYFIENGIHLYKTRHDVTTDTKIFDYKTVGSKDWSVYGLRAQIIKYGYDFSAAMYQYFEYKRTGIWKPFIIVWIMKDPPYDILIHDISEFCYQVIDETILINSGARAFQEIKEIHQTCEVSGTWPGLSAKFGGQIADFGPRYDRENIEFEIEVNEF